MSIVCVLPKDVVLANELELKVNNNEVSKNSIELAQSTWYLYVSAMTSESELGSYYLGTPFSIEASDDSTISTSIFPIIDKISSKVVYTLQILNDGSNATILETSLADELTKPTNRKFDNRMNIYNILSDGSDIPEEQIHQYDKKMVNNFSIRERQTNQPWCLYFTYASVINTLEKKEVTNAKDLVKYNYPNATESQLMDEKYITGQQSYDTTLKNLDLKTGYKSTLLKGRLSNQAFKNEINSNRPFIMDIRNSRVGHALTAIGYVEAKDPKFEDFYIAWNPLDYNGGYMMLSSKQLDNINSGGELFSWAYTVYNFKK